MSNERDLLMRVKVLLECVDTAPLQDQADLAIKEIQELLQPESFMFKDRELTGSLIVHDDMYKKGYAQAEFHLKREPLSDQEVIAKYKDIALDNPLYVPSYYAGFRDAEKAHGIGGGE